jgi:hypothetical protein
LLLLVPFIPGLRDVPRLIPVHRLIWRSWYHTDPGSAGGPDLPRPAGQTPASQAQRPVLLAAPVTSQADASAQPPADKAGAAGLTPSTYSPSIIPDG